MGWSEALSGEWMSDIVGRASGEGSRAHMASQASTNESGKGRIVGWLGGLFGGGGGVDSATTPCPGMPSAQMIDAIWRQMTAQERARMSQLHAKFNRGRPWPQNNVVGWTRAYGGDDCIYSNPDRSFIEFAKRMENKYIGRLQRGEVDITTSVGWDDWITNDMSFPREPAGKPLMPNSFETWGRRSNIPAEPDESGPPGTMGPRTDRTMLLAAGLGLALVGGFLILR